jgi:hypothetical protein
MGRKSFTGASVGFVSKRCQNVVPNAFEKVVYSDENSYHKFNAVIEHCNILACMVSSSTGTSMGWPCVAGRSPFRPEPPCACPG